MNSDSIDTIRTIDKLLSELLDLDPDSRGERLAALHRDSPAMAMELSRLLDSCVEDGRLHAAGALEGALAQECLLGRSTEPPLAVGAEIGPYRIEGLLGRGGMAHVYRASRHFDGFVQQVALKLMRSGQFDQSFRTRLLLEQRALVRLSHPNIARFLDAGLAEDGDAYLAMELVEGVPINLHANAIGADLQTRVGWMIDLCAALSHAHAQLIVHCDIKPSNVLVDRDGRLRLLDFGIARIMGDAVDGDDAGTGVKLYTPDCAAPEQLTHSPATTATDIFQVGALLYRLIVGKSWLTKCEALARGDLDAITQEIPVAPSRRLRAGCLDPAVQANALACGFRSTQALANKVKGGLDAIVLSCLAKQPADRYASVELLGHDLQNWLKQLPLSVVPNSEMGRLKLWVSRNRKSLGLTAAALACVLIVAGVSMGRITTERTAKAREQERALAVESFLAKVFLQASPFLSEGQGNALQTLSQVGDSLLASEEGLDARTRVRLTTALGRLDLDRGRFDLAEARARSALAFVEKTEGHEPDAVFELRRLLGAALTRQGRLDEALAVLEDKSAQASALMVVPLRRAQFGTMIGDLHRRQGRLADAKRYFEPALAILLRDDVTIDSGYLDALQRSAIYLDQSGEGMKRFDPIIRRLGAPADTGESSVLRARRLMLLSYVEAMGGRPIPAGEHAREAANTFASTIGEDHPRVSKARATACAAFRDGGSLNPARQQCVLALESLQRQGRASSDDATVVRINLAGIEFSSGDFVAAQLQLAAVLPTLAGEPFQNTFSTLLQGRVDYRRGRLQAALDSYRRASGLQRKHFPDNIELASHIGVHMASALIATGQIAEARRMLADTEPGGMPDGLLRDRLLADRLMVQGQLDAASGQQASAKAKIEQGLKAYGALSSLSQNERAWALLDAGETLLRIGESAAASERFKQALDSGLSADQTPALWAWSVIRLEQLSRQPFTAAQRSKAEKIRRLQLGTDALGLPQRS